MGEVMYKIEKVTGEIGKVTCNLVDVTGRFNKVTCNTDKDSNDFCLFEG